MLKPPAVRRRQPDGAGPTRPAGGAGEPGRDSAIERVLVIKLGALGDFVQATGAFQAIRAHHCDAHVTLLTTAPYAGFARASGYFDEVWVDSRPKLWQVGALLALTRNLRARRFDRVYDLQASHRSNAYFRLFGRRRPEWSGIVRGCSHPHTNPGRDLMHVAHAWADQLAVAGIRCVPPPDLSWVQADIGRFGLSGRYALLVPGSAAHRPAKRWPAERFAAFATWLLERDVRPVLVGAAAERSVLAEITRLCPAALDLCDQTSFAEIVTLAREAAGAVGNDTGPMHLIAVAGCPCVTLFSAASNPEFTGPCGPSVTVLQRPSLANLSVYQVISVLQLR